MAEKYHSVGPAGPAKAKRDRETSLRDEQGAFKLRKYLERALVAQGIRTFVLQCFPLM